MPLPLRAACQAVALFVLLARGAFAADLRTDIDRMADQLEPRVIEWRRDIHQNPELGNREFRTAAKVAEHLKALGLEVRTGVAHTGVVAVLRGGNRFNIIPDKVEMDGTIRTFDEAMRDDIHRRVKTTAEHIAAASGAQVTVAIEKPYSVTVNDPDLTERMLPTLKRVAGEDDVKLRSKTTGAEDFSLFARKAPGLFVFLGGSPKGTDLAKVAYNHSPRFYVDESALKLGMRSLAHLTVDYMEGR